MGEENKEQEPNNEKQPPASTNPYIVNEQVRFVGQEPTEVTSAGLFKPTAEGYSLPENFINSTGIIIGGTISTLEALKRTIQVAENDTFSAIESNIDKKLTQDLQPIHTELENTKKQLEITTDSLKSLGSFIEQNKPAFISLISIEGKMQGLEGLVSSIGDRVEKLETDRNFKWNQTATIITIVVAILSLCCGVTIGLISGFLPGLIK